MSVTSCPICGADSCVKDCREGKEFFWRRRRCKKDPSHRWTTAEVYAAPTGAGQSVEKLFQKRLAREGLQVAVKYLKALLKEIK